MRVQVYASPIVEQTRRQSGIFRIAGSKIFRYEPPLITVKPKQLRVMPHFKKQPKGWMPH
jgi:hypothetical protein